ncbi:protein RKD1-like [Carex rostrata]
MAPFSRINNRVQAINPADGGVFGLELLQAVGQFMNGDVENGAFAAVPNVQGLPPPVNVQDRMNDRVDDGTVNGLTFEMVALFFKLPVGLAARELGISRSSLMIWSRINRIPRWPYRMIKSLEKLITTVKLYGVGFKCQVKGLDFIVEQLERRKRSFEKDPTVEIETSILHFRTIILKRVACMRWRAARNHNG